MPSIPTQRTLAELKERGMTAQVVEKFNRFANRRIDLFGVIDVIAMKPGIGIVGIQATGGSGGNHAARRAKILAEPRVGEWLASGGKLWLWSWAKRGPRGKRKLWTLRPEEITAADLVRVEAVNESPTACVAR